MRRAIVGFLVALAFSPAVAQDQSAETLEGGRRLVPVDAADIEHRGLRRGGSLEDLERDQFLLDGTIWERIEEAARKKAIQCMKAFPHRQFCSCLSSELPMILSIAQYSFIVSASREELRYDELSEDERKMIDVTRAARERCAQGGL